MTVWIYSLNDPITGECRYVGKTCNLKQRLCAHISKIEDNHKSNWIQHLLSIGAKPSMMILETIEDSDDEDWQEREIFWIDEMRRRGCNLTNLDGGGHAGRKISESTKAKLRAINLGKKASPEARKKMSEKRKGVKFTPEHAAKIGEANRRRIYSNETRMKISMALKGRVAPLYQREKMSSALRRGWANGTRFISDQTKAKISRTLTWRGILKKGIFECEKAFDCLDVPLNDFILVL